MNTFLNVKGRLDPFEHYHLGMLLYNRERLCYVRKPRSLKEGTET